MPQRSTVVLVLTAALLLALLPGAAAEESEGGATVHGSGFGHGVGMSQYGARSLAEKGASADDIIQHYYTDVQVEEREVGSPGAHGLRVGLTTSQTVWSLDNAGDSAASLEVRLGDEAEDDPMAVAPGETVRIDHLDGDECQVEVAGASDPQEAACDDLEVHWPVTSAAPDTFVSLDRDSAHDLALARGWIEFVQAGDEVHTVLRIGMEDYLYGLAEMPSSWPAAALQTQAIAGRTYAQSRVLRLPAAGAADCSCHLGTTIAHQHYTGWGKEGEGAEGQWGARWVAAVDATNSDDRSRGQVITHAGSLINAYYSSSSPGTTEDPRDIWGGDVAYLEPVDDSHAHDGDANNHMSSWTREFDYDDFSERLGFDAVTRVELVGHLRSGNPGVYRVEGLADGQEQVEELHTYSQLRPLLGLPSHGIFEIELELPGDFRDVPPGHPFHAEITWLLDRDLTSGYDDGTFRPGIGVSRQAAVAFLHRLAGEPEPEGESAFFDVDDEHPFHDAITWASEQEIVSGYDEGTFRPGAPVTRQAMAAFLAHLEFDGEVPAAEASGFDDVGADHPFHDEIAWMAESGLADGFDDGTFRPGQVVTRQAAAAFLYRYAAD